MSMEPSTQADVDTIVVRKSSASNYDISIIMDHYVSSAGGMSGGCYYCFLYLFILYL